LTRMSESTSRMSRAAYKEMNWGGARALDDIVMDDD
jgi:hypothetical protein